IRSDDSRMQRRAECIESGERKFAVNHRFVREAAAGTAVLLRHRCAKQTGLTGFGPHIAIVDAGLMPAVEMRNELVGDKAARLLFEQDKVFAHPLGSWKIECVHRSVSLPKTLSLRSLFFGGIFHILDLVDLDVL